MSSPPGIPIPRSRRKPPEHPLAFACAMLAVVALARTTSAQNIAPGFWVTDGTVHAALISGNTLYLGGSFSSIGPPSGANTTVEMS